jgi:hypothetical protein
MNNKNAEKFNNLIKEMHTMNEDHENRHEYNDENKGRNNLKYAGTIASVEKLKGRNELLSSNQMGKNNNIRQVLLERSSNSPIKEVNTFSSSGGKANFYPNIYSQQDKKKGVLPNVYSNNSTNANSFNNISTNNSNSNLFNTQKTEDSKKMENLKQDQMRKGNKANSSVTPNKYPIIEDQYNNLASKVNKN